jgi:hypothetical protein
MFVYMVHKDTKGTTYVPDDEAAIKSHEARGWEKAEEPPAEVFVPRTVEPDEGGWVDLIHLDTGGTQRLPNDDAALAEAFDKGWALPDARTDTEREADENAASARKASAPADAKHGKPSPTAETEKE